MNLKQRLLLYITSISLGAVVIGVLIITPTIHKILFLRSDIGIIQQELENRYEKTQKLKRSLQELEQVRDVNNKFEAAIIQPGDELRVITELEAIATNNNIEQNTDLIFVDTTKEKKKDPAAKKHVLPQYYQFSFLNNGYFEDHINYLRALEKLPYYIIIDNLNFEKRKGDEDIKSKITLRFNGIIYVQTK